MSTAKEEILGRIRSALDDAPAPTEVPRNYRRTSQLPAAEVLAMLEDRLIDYRANVYHESAATIAERLAELLPENATFVIPEGLQQSWLPEGDHRRVVVESRDERVGLTLSVRELNEVDAVITSSTVSCAETGTIFLSGRPEEGRRAISLVPDHHICVVPVDTVVELIPEALARVESTAPITMISGPSATSDIELERVEGVHGPRTLDVILLS